VFCQLGRTTKKTITRKEYVPTDAVISELAQWLEEGNKADYITLSGSGEPTLHCHFGRVIEFVRNHSSIPAVLLTNGSMLGLQEVQEAASLANIVKVSLSAWDQASYAWINRPHPSLRFRDLVKAQKSFRIRFKGQLWLEVVLIAGMNSTPADVKRIAALAEEIEPDRIHLNTVVRPPAEEFATPLSEEYLHSLCHLFHPAAEVIAEFKADKESEIRINEEAILGILRRRPCTAEQLARIFNMHPNEVAKYLGSLLRTGQIFQKRKDHTVYYGAIEGSSLACN